MTTDIIIKQLIPLLDLLCYTLVIRPCPLPYIGLFSLGANYPEWWTLSISSFPNLEFHNPKYLITHVSDVSYKVYDCT